MTFFTQFSPPSLWVDPTHQSRLLTFDFIHRLWGCDRAQQGRGGAHGHGDGARGWVMEAEPTVGEDGTRTHMSHTICESKTSKHQGKNWCMQIKTTAWSGLPSHHKWMIYGHLLDDLGNSGKWNNWRLMKNVHDGWMMHERLLDESRSHILAPIGCMCVYVYIYIRNVDIEINFYPYLKKCFIPLDARYTIYMSQLASHHLYGNFEILEQTKLLCRASSSMLWSRAKHNKEAADGDDGW
jgi:hypothetical protein